MSSREPLDLSVWNIKNSDKKYFDKYTSKKSINGDKRMNGSSSGNKGSNGYSSGNRERTGYSSGDKGRNGYSSGNRERTGYSSGDGRRNGYSSGNRERTGYSSGDGGRNGYSSGNRERTGYSSGDGGRNGYSSGNRERTGYSSGDGGRNGYPSGDGYASKGYERGGVRNNKYITNENTQKLIQNVSEKIEYIKNKVNIVHEWWTTIPLSMKLSNIVLFFILTYIFTYKFYNITLSIVFSIFTFLLVFLLNKLLAIFYLLIYFILLIKIIRNNNYIYGYPIRESMINNGECITSSLVISGSNLPQELSQGNYTYSFWIFVNDTNYINNKNNIPLTIFYRGESINSTNTTNFIQFPGFWLDQNTNNLIVRFNNGTSTAEDIIIQNIDLDQWLYITCVENELSIAIYVNGKLELTKILTQPLMIMNDYSLYITSGLSTDNSNSSTSISNISNTSTVVNSGSTTCTITGKTTCINSDASSTNYSGYNFSGKIAYIVLYNYSLSPDDVYKAYTYYKKCIDNYQNKIKNKIVNQSYTVVYNSNVSSDIGVKNFKYK